MLKLIGDNEKDIGTTSISTSWRKKICRLGNCVNPTGVIRGVTLLMHIAPLVRSISSFPDDNLRKFSSLNPGLSVWLYEFLFALILVSMGTIVAGACFYPFGSLKASWRIRLTDGAIHFVEGVALFTFGLILCNHVIDYIEIVCGTSDSPPPPHIGRGGTPRNYVECDRDRSNFTNYEHCNCDTKEIIKFDSAHSAGKYSVMAGLSILALVVWILLPRKEIKAR